MRLFRSFYRRGREPAAVIALVQLEEKARSWIFSGVFFSATSFPEAAHPFIQALPLTAAADALRSNLLEGASVAALAPELGILGAWLAVAFSAAVALFRWR